MKSCVRTKIAGSVKGAGLVLLLGAAAMTGAHPFVPRPHHSQTRRLSAIPFTPSLPSLPKPRIATVHPAPSQGRTAPAAPARPVARTMLVRPGETLADTLTRAGIPAAEASGAVAALSGHFDPRGLKAGQKVALTVAHPAIGGGHLVDVALTADPLHRVAVQATPSGYAAHTTALTLTRKIAHRHGVIHTSLYDSARAAGIPPAIIARMIHTLSYDVDFQRDLRSGDGFDVMFDGRYDADGKLVHDGTLLYATLRVDGRPITFYRYKTRSGLVDYFDPTGHSLRKALLRTPVDGARITSAFGMRMHPMLGYSKMHEGVDFGVPAGTPIMAAGDGVVEAAGYHGTYGNYVRLRHAGGYGTAYAHMRRIAKGIRVGRHIRQGQVIGYVGTTGRSTGPHLHYEVMIGMHRINPMSAKVPIRTILAGADLKRFRQVRARLDGLLAALPPRGTRILAALPPGARTD
jgi:murein DD-endopeptidase MepM/ murein hydrolase activator NlpD